MTRKKLVNSVPTPFENSRYDYYEVNEPPKERRTKKQQLCRCCAIFTIIAFVIATLTFTTLFIVLPITFMNSIEMQRTLVFASSLADDQVEYTNFRKYGIEGARNLYADLISDGQNITLGLWQIIPLGDVCTSYDNDEFNYDFALRFSSKPVLLYFHDTNVNRNENVNVYRILRRFFHIIAFDYRGSGDSTSAPTSEQNVVDDSVELYKWLQTKTNAEIYIWGHSLGAAISAHTTVKLRKQNIVPMGVFLEAPFTSLRNQLLYSHPIAKYFSWMPWFDKTVLNSLEESGFEFNTVAHILSIDCPIMIMHAEDDEIVPYFLSEELYRVAQDMRDPETKGTITLHIFQKSLKLGHNQVYEALEMPTYIRNHIGVCKEFKHRNIEP